MELHSNIVAGVIGGGWRLGIQPVWRPSVTGSTCKACCGIVGAVIVLAVQPDLGRR
jgi:uncharacterized membrane protein YeaQ/YmgE (transglycosylase-associated protein family)